MFRTHTPDEMDAAERYAHEVWNLDEDEPGWHEAIDEYFRMPVDAISGAAR